MINTKNVKRNEMVKYIFSGLKLHELSIILFE